MKIILGSQSKGRRKMLEEMGLDFTVMAADIDERAIRFADPQILVLAIANAKAEALKPKISEPAILITADEVVYCNGKIMEKPSDEKEARDFLRTYNLFSPETISGIVVTNLATGKKAEVVDVAGVCFKNFAESDIDFLFSHGEMLNLAGGFGIEGIWAQYVDSIVGTRDSVIGLPKELTQKLIDEVLN